MGASPRVSQWVSSAAVLLMLSPLAVGQPAVVSAATSVCTASTFTAGGFVSAGISNGTLYMWGANGDGQLGLGFFSGGQPTPRPVLTTTGLVSPRAVWTWGGSSFAIDSSGQLWGWGDNYWGELGRPTTVKRFASPVQITGPNHVVQASSGGFSTMALTADHTVWGWGTSFFGGLGFVQSTPQPTPVVLSGLSDIVEVSDGPYTSVALKADGTVYGAGQNMAGELGLGNGVPQTSTFQPLPGLSNVMQVAINGEGNLSAYVVAVDQSGRVFAAGNNQDGEMGNGSPSSTKQVTFAQVPNLGSVVAVAAGDSHILALKSDHTVWAWGSNSYGQLGDGTTYDKAAPLQVSFPAGTQLVGVAAGFSHSMALDSSGNLWAWGSNSLGELGIGTISTLSTTPVKVALVPVSASCGSGPRTYIPSLDGYQFNNSTASTNSGSFYVPTYDEMAGYYPASRNKMYHSSGSRSTVGKWFYDQLFAPFYRDGLCFGMATSDTFLYNRASPPPGTYSLWTSLDTDFGGDTLTPPVLTGDQTIQQFIDRYHARQLAALAAQSAVGGWSSIAFNTGPLFTFDRTYSNLGTFDQIKAQVKKAPEVVVFGPSPYILTGGPQLVPNPLGIPPLIPLPPPNPVRFYTLFNNSHAVVAYDAFVRADGTRVIKVYDPSSATLFGKSVINESEIDIASDGSLKLIDFANGAGPKGQPTVWIGGGIDSSGRDMGQPGDWILVPLADVAFSDNGIVNGADNHHWFIPDAVATAINKGDAPWSLLAGKPSFFHISGPGSGAIAETLPTGAGYDNTITALGTGALTAVTINGHLVTATQTDGNASGSTHHIVVDPAAISIRLDSATQAEVFNLEIAGDYLPSYSRDITMQGVSLAPSQNLSVSSDAQTSTLNVLASSATSTRIQTTFAQTGSSPGRATVIVTIPGRSIPAVVSVFDWNNLGTSLIYEVIDAQGNPTGLVLQANPVQLRQQVSNDFVGLLNTIATISDVGLRTSLQAKVASAQDSFTRGQSNASANTLHALRNEVDAQAGKTLDAATATKLRQLSADALVLLGAS